MALKLPEKVPHSSICICQILYPVITFARVLGLCPISFERNPDKPCAFVDKLSFFYFQGAIIFAIDIYATISCFYFLDHYFSQIYKGTELIASTMQIKFSYLQVAIVVGNAFAKRRQFKLLYSKLIEAHYKLLTHKCKLPGICLEYKVFCEREYRPVVRRIPGYILFIIIHTALFTYFFAKHMGANCRKTEKNTFCATNASLVVTSIASTIRTLTPQVFAILFLTFCTVVRIAFSYITACVKEILIFEESNERLTSVNAFDANQSEQSQMEDVAHTFEFIRIIHEDLCEIIDLISKLFGLPILTILVMGVISVSAGIYSIQSGLVEDKFGNLHQYTGLDLEIQKHYSNLWSVLIYICTLQAFLILYFGQLVTNVASSPLKYLMQSRFNNSNLKMNTQIIQFVDKLGHSSPTIRALGMTTIKLSLVATLFTTVTTYVLVLVQLRSSIG